MKTHTFRQCMVCLTLLVAVAALTVSAPAAVKNSQPQRVIDKLVYPKLNPIAQPNVIRETLPNGMQLLLIEARELPKVEFQARIRGGRVAEPKDKNSLMDVFGDVLRTGGTQKMSGDQVDELLDRLGAVIESGVEDDAVTLYGRCLKENLDQVLDLYAGFMMQPAFAQDKIDLTKTQLKSVISRRNDNAQEIARREFTKLIFGPASPYARQYEYDDLDAIVRDDLTAFHARTFRPDQTILAVWGDFSAAEMKDRLAKAFSGWKNEGAPARIEKPAIPAPQASISYIEKKDIQQTYLILGHQGLRFDDPDYPAVQVMSDILGNGFSSRIFVKVRTEKGLAYGAGGSMMPAYDHTGNFFFYTSTKPASTAEALSTILDEIRKIREAPVTDSELARAKEGYLNGYAFDYDSKGKIVNRLMTYDFYGYPADFNTRLRDAVEKVTKEDVLRVAQKHLHPELLTILAVGRADQFDKPLDTFGKVNTIDITIPAPKGKDELPAATPESLLRGKELLQLAARAKGEAALLGLKDLVAEGVMTRQTGMGSMDLKFKSTTVLPDKVQTEITTPMGAMVINFDGTAGWVKVGPNIQDLPGSAAAEMKGGLATENGCLLLLQQALAGTVEAQALGLAVFEGQNAEAVLVRFGETPVRIFLAPDTRQVLGTRQQGQTEEGPADIVEVFSAYTDIAGLQVPMQTVATANGKPRSSSKLSAVKLNTTPDPGLFSRPAAEQK